MAKPTFLDPLIGKTAGQTELVNAELGTVLATHVEPAFDARSRKKGLLGQTSIPDDFAMIIAPCSAVHTFSMRVPIDAVFVARDGRITKVSRALRPWRLAGSFGAFAVIEAAAGFIDRHEILPGDTVAVRDIPNRRRATDTLPALAAAAPERRPEALPRPAAHKHVTLADVVAAREPLAWFESLAIVQELCESVMARGPADDMRVPELKHIAVTAEGRVTLLADGPRGHSAVQRCGLVAFALTPELQFPMQLRLLVLEEVSPRPRLTALGDLHRELEFYERPDRRAIVIEVYERFQRQRAQAAGGVVVPPPLLEPPPPKPAGRWWRRKSVWVGVAIVIVTAGAGAALWAWPRPEGAWMRAGVSRSYRFVTTTGERGVQTARREVDAFKWRVGLTRREPVQDVALRTVPPSAPAGAAAASPGAPPDPDMTTASVAPQLPAIELPRTPLAGSAGQAAAGAVPVSPGGASAERLPELEFVYSAADSRVVPPRLVGQKPTPNQPPARSDASAPVVEVVVSASGEVEAVRLVSGGGGTQPGMQLSAIKAWRFTPATLDGKAVRYRQRFTLKAR